MKNEKITWGFFFHKQSKFLSISLEDLVDQKLFISQECSDSWKDFLKLVFNIYNVKETCIIGWGIHKTYTYLISMLTN